MIRIIVILALLMASGREAVAQDAPKLKELVTVTADVVTMPHITNQVSPTTLEVGLVSPPD